MLIFVDVPATRNEQPHILSLGSKGESENVGIQMIPSTYHFQHMLMFSLVSFLHYRMLILVNYSPTHLNSLTYARGLNNHSNPARRVLRSS